VDADHLRSTVHEVRQTLSSNSLPEKALRDSLIDRLNRVIYLYRGEFLQNFHLSKAAMFDEWVLQQRAALQSSMMEVCEVLVQCCLSQGNFRVGLEATHHLLTMMPWSETGHRLQMQLLAESGQVITALAQYDTLQQILADEVDAAPSVETRWLYEQIKTGEYTPQYTPAHPTDVQDDAAQALPQSPPAPSSVTQPNLPHPSQRETATSTKPTIHRATEKSLHALSEFLPAASTFIGRDEEINDLSEMLSDPTCRLVTILGMGGIGKTYLVAEAIRKFAHQTPGQGSAPQPIYFIPLVGIQSASVLPEAILQAMEINPSQESDFLAQICRHLRKEEALLIFDNFEHLLDVEPAESTLAEKTAAEIVTHILKSTEYTQCLITSRQPLRLQYEYLFHLEGMKLPLAGQSPPQSVNTANALTSSAITGSVINSRVITEMQLTELSEVESIRLFLQAARRSRRTFRLTIENAQAIVKFCTLVQGTPLAIVLAAAAMDVMTPQQLVDLSQDNLDVLQAHWNDVSDRQRSVRVIFDYSWQRLDGTLQSIFQKLTIFRGGFTAEAAEAVVGATVQQLQQLYQHSLLKPTETGRYEIHELLRQFGFEKFEVAQNLTPEPLEDSVWTHHMRYYLQWLGEQQASMEGNRPNDAFEEIAVDINNIRQAWQQAIQQKDLVAMAVGAKALATFYLEQALYQPGLVFFQRATEMLEPLITQLTVNEEGSQKRSSTEQGVQKDGGTPASWQLCETYSLLLVQESIFHFDSGSDYQEAIARLRQAIVLSEVIPPEQERKYDILGTAHYFLGKCQLRQGEYENVCLQADYVMAAAAQISAQSPLHQRLAADSDYVRAMALGFLEEYDRAIDCVHNAYKRYVKLGNSRREVDALDVLSAIHFWAGHIVIARTYTEQGLAQAKEVGYELKKYELGYGLAQLDLVMGNYAASIHAGKEVIHFFQRANEMTYTADINLNLGMAYQRLGLYTEAQAHIHEAIRLSRLMGTPEEEIRYLTGLASTYQHLGHDEQALALLTDVEAMVDEQQMEHYQPTLLLCKGHVLSKLGHIAESIDYYRRGLTFSTIGNEEVHIELKSHLAAILCQSTQHQDVLSEDKNRSNNLSVAQGYIEEVLLYLDQNPDQVYLFIETFELHLNCYRVLVACQDPRAMTMLKTTHTLLQTCAERIDVPGWRQSFLENVAVNRAILEEVERVIG
ncbi:MAG: BTAD domain-containing putative transcriptional regulator, partial [Chloroflexota bacterium]